MEERKQAANRNYKDSVFVDLFSEDKKAKENFTTGLYMDSSQAEKELQKLESRIEKLKNSKIVLFGLGGVGSYIAEALARVGIGNLIIVDGDTVDITNINRQIHSNVKTIGKYKAEVLKSRIEDINPECIVNINIIKLEKENIDSFNLATYDYVIDAIDDTSAKLSLITYCLSNKIMIRK